MKIIIILTIILIVIFLINTIKKSKKTKNNISEDTIKILLKYFGEKDFSDIKDLESLKNRLEIKPIYKKDLETIVQKVKHTYEILYLHNMKSNKSYIDSHTYNIIVNTVVAHSIRHNIDMKKSIKLFILVIKDSFIQELLTEEITKEEELEIFYENFTKFIERYNKYNDENKDM